MKKLKLTMFNLDSLKKSSIEKIKKNRMQNITGGTKDDCDATHPSPNYIHCREGWCNVAFDDAGR